jgi:peptidoglycan/xylan/chitin deacetylase (PgdA/CDA1 family)
MVVYRGNNGDRKVALTFDDGPNPIYTATILSALRKAGAKATFFLVGRNVEQYPGLAREIIAEGHAVGNHTYSHVKLDSGDVAVIKDELARASEVIEKITGATPMFFRPPAGRLDNGRLVEDAAESLGMRTVLWNVDCGDWIWPWETRSNNNLVVWRQALRIYRKAARLASPGAIIDLHDGTEFAGVKNAEKRALPTSFALPRILKVLQTRKHLEIVQLSQMDLLEEPFESGDGAASRQGPDRQP